MIWMDESSINNTSFTINLAINLPKVLGVNTKITTIPEDSRYYPFCCNKLQSQNK